MAISYLRWFCAAVFSFPLVVFAAGPVSTEVAAGTTTYRVVSNTVRTPSNVSVSAARDITPYVEKISGRGLAQSAQGRLIVAQRAASVPLSGFFNVSGAVVKSGAKSFLRTAGKASVVGLGLQALLDTADWVFDDDGQIVAPLPSAGNPKPVTREVALTYDAVANGGTGYLVDKLVESEMRQFPAWYTLNGQPRWFYAGFDLPWGFQYYYFPDTLNVSIGGVQKTVYLDAYYDAGSNDNQSNSVGAYSLDEPVAGLQPVTDEQLEAGIDEFYEPEPSDWPELFPYIEPDTFTLSPLPSLSLEPEITTSVDNITGETIVTESQTTLDFDVSENNTSQPEVSVSESTTTKRYKNGVLVSSTSDTVVSNPLPSGSGSPPAPPAAELPAFCSWASVICDWIGWTQEPIDDDVDLSSILIDIDDFERSKDISFGAKSCPADIPLEIDFIDKTVMLSFRWFCELAEIIYFMVMAAAYVSAAYITLGVVRG